MLVGPRRNLSLFLAIRSSARRMPPEAAIPDFHFSTDGDDTTGDGSFATPWKTVTKFNAQSFSAGALIAFKNGDEWVGADYARLTPPSSGVSGNPIIITSYGPSPDQPIFNAGIEEIGVGGDWTNEGSNRWSRSVTTAPNQVMFTVSGPTKTKGVEASSSANVTESPEWFWASNKLWVFSTSNPATAFTRVELTNTSASQEIVRTNAGIDFVTIQELHFTNSRQYCMRIVDGDTIITIDCEFSYSWAQGVMLITNSIRCTIRGGSIHDTGTFTITGGNDNTGQGLAGEGGASDITIDGVEIYNTSSSGITLLVNCGDGWDIKNGNVHGFGVFGINLKDGTNHTVSDNIIDGTAFPGSIRAANGRWGQRGLIVRALTASAVTVTAENNDVSHCGHVLFVGDGPCHLISRRNFYGISRGDTGAGSVLQLGSGSIDVGMSLTSESDIFFNDHSDMPDGKGIIDINSGTDISFVNATIWDARGSGSYALKHDNQFGALTSLTLRNCTIISDNGIPLHYEPAAITTLVIDTVHLERPGTTSFVQIVGGNTYDESDIPANFNDETGVSGTHKTGAPAFKSTTKGNQDFFRPTIGSPLDGTGIGSGPPANDNNNVPFRSQRNIGAVALAVA